MLKPCGHDLQVGKELSKFLPTLAMVKGELTADKVTRQDSWLRDNRLPMSLSELKTVHPMHLKITILMLT